MNLLYDVILYLTFVGKLMWCTQKIHLQAQIQGLIYCVILDKGLMCWINVENPWAIVKIRAFIKE